MVSGIRRFVVSLLLIAFISTVQATDLAPQERTEALQMKISALVDSGATGQVKAMLNVAMERVKACLEINDTEDATVWLNDVEVILARKSEMLAKPNPDIRTISLMKMPKVVEGNPYLQRLVDGAKAELSQPAKTWAKNTPTLNTFTGLSGESGSRSTGEEMEAWLWLFANPTSPMKGSPAALARFLRLAQAYADALDVHGGNPNLDAEVALITDSGPKAGQGLLDDFAIAPASDALREFAQLQPGLLLPAQKAQWDRAMANGGRLSYGKAKNRPGKYANIDIALGFELVNFGLYLKNNEYIEKAKFLIEAQKKNIYSDGAIAYIGNQNDSCTYHDVDVHYLARYYQITGSDQVYQMLQNTEWYGPVSENKLCEFWTAPSWKDTWNSNRVFCGGEEAASISKNPYLREMCDEVLAKFVELKSWAQNYAPLPWYRNDVKPLPLPDNYTVIDRNIGGPRAWYGRFNYACTTRSIPNSESGLPTMMGVQVTSPDGQLGQIAMDIFTRIRTDPNELTKKGDFNRAAFASRMADLKSTVVMGNSFSAVAGSYVLQEYRSSSPGNRVNWAGQQVWLGLSDRVIGLVEVKPTKEGAKGIDVEGVVRLGTGGTVHGPATEIKRLGINIWQYGDLTVSILAHNYASIQTPEVPFRVPNFPNTEIRLLDEKGTAGATLISGYKMRAPLYYLVEIRSSYSSYMAQAKVMESNASLGMDVRLGPKHFLLAANLTNGDLGVNLPDGFTGGPLSIHSSQGSVLKQVLYKLILKPMEMQVVVSSPDAADHLSGWQNLREMVGTLERK